MTFSMLLLLLLRTAVSISKQDTVQAAHSSYTLHVKHLQVASYDLLKSLMPFSVEPAVLEVGGVKVTVDLSQ